MFRAGFLYRGLAFFVWYAPLFARSQLQNSYRYVNFSILMLNRKVGHFFCGVEWQALKSHFNTSKICLEQDSQWGACFFVWLFLHKI